MLAFAVINTEGATTHRICILREAGINFPGSDIVLGQSTTREVCSYNRGVATPRDHRHVCANDRRSLAGRLRIMQQRTSSFSFSALCVENIDQPSLLSMFA